MTTDAVVKKYQVEGDTLEELTTEFLVLMAAAGSFLVQNSTAKVPKPYGKLILTGGDKPYESSFEIEWPDVRLDVPGELLGAKAKGSVKQMPRWGKLDVRFTDLQEPANKKQIIQTRAATVLADLARLQAEAKRLGLVPNSAGEETGE